MANEAYETSFIDLSTIVIRGICLHIDTSVNESSG